MNTYYRCDVCYRQVKSERNELVSHCDTYHYGQSIDLLFPGHGLDYKPMDPLLKRRLVAVGEVKMGKALIGHAIVKVETPIEIISESAYFAHNPHAITTPIRKPQMRPILSSDAWEELVCQGWVTIATELTPAGEIAVMEKFS